MKRIDRAQERFWEEYRREFGRPEGDEVGLVSLLVTYQSLTQELGELLKRPGNLFRVSRGHSIVHAEQAIDELKHRLARLRANRKGVPA